MKKISVLLLLIVTQLLAFGISQEEAKSIFEQGNQFYQEAKYQEAVDKYSQIIDNYSSFELYYNLGNAYYKLGKIPEAILYYEKAKKINPGDEDLKTNLQVANLKVVDKIDKLPTLAISDFGNSFISKEKLSLWAWSSIIFLFIAVGLIIFYMNKKSATKSRSPLILGLFFSVISLTSFGIGQYGKSQLNNGKDAIIFSPKVDVLNQPNGDQTEFVLHQGTKVHLRKTQKDWIEIKLDNGSVGWIKAKDCKIV